MAKVKNYGCQLQISKSTTLLEMSVKFYAVLSLSFCVALVINLFPGPLPDQKGELKRFLQSYKRRPNYCSPVSCSHYMFLTEQAMMPTGVLLFVFETFMLWMRRYTNLSVASCELSVASCELSVDICQLRVDICQLSVASCELSVDIGRLRVDICQLSVASCELRVVS